MSEVTIGLPVYNGAEFLDGALASLCAQTFADLRIVISDNASTDATPDIIATWAARDPRVEAHRQPRNIGMVPNFAWVVERAAPSPWFMLAAHDDTWSPTFVEALHRAATARPGCLLAVPQVIKTHPDGSEALREPVPAALDRAEGLARRRMLLRAARSGWVYGLFDRRAKLAAQAPTDRFGHTWGNEFITMLPILLSGRVAASNEAIYYQRQTGLSEDRYKPKTLADQKALYGAFLREARALLAEADLTPAQRLMLLPEILRYTDAHAWKLRRLVRSTLRQALTPG